MNWNNCIHVSGPVDTLRAFFDACEASGEFTLAPWMEEVDEDEESPEGFVEPCVMRGENGENDGVWTAAWDSWDRYYDTLLRTSEAWPTLRFDYHIASLEGEPAFHRAVYEGGECVDSDDTEDPIVAQEWDAWFRCEAKEWMMRLSVGEHGDHGACRLP